MPLFHIAIRIENNQGQYRYVTKTIKADDPDGACHRVYQRYHPRVESGKYSRFVVVGMSVVKRKP